MRLIAGPCNAYPSEGGLRFTSPLKSETDPPRRTVMTIPSPMPPPKVRNAGKSSPLSIAAARLLRTLSSPWAIGVLAAPSVRRIGSFGSLLSLVGGVRADGHTTPRAARRERRNNP